MSTTNKTVSAVATTQIDNDRVRATEYRFASGAETKWHKHQWDYIVIPQTDGEVLLLEAEGKETKAILTCGIPYYRQAGIEHNVINIGAQELVFIEIEIKA